MTVPGRTALDNLTRPGPDPDCPVCLGTGTDLVFETDCTECWSRRDANVRDAQEQINANWARHQATPRTAMRTAPRTEQPTTAMPTTLAAVRAQWREDSRAIREIKLQRRTDWKRAHPTTMRMVDAMRGTNP